MVEAPAGAAAGELRRLAASVLRHAPHSEPGAVILGAVADGKARLVAAITRPLVDHAGIHAVDLLHADAARIGDGDGGTGTTANAGGGNPEHPEALGGLEDARAFCQWFVTW